MKRWIGMWAITLSFSVFASGAQQLHKRFDFVKKNNELTHVLIKRVSTKFTLAPYLRQVKSDLKVLVSTNKNTLDSQIDELQDWIEENSSEKADLSEKVLAIRDALYELKGADVDSIFKTISDKGIFKKLESELSDLFLNFSPAIIANTTDARFFYKRNVSYEVIKKVLDFARKRLSSLPILNVAAVMIDRVHNMILDQRAFHQNMLLHYLQNYSEIELGLTKSEVDRVISSIYESRISALNYMESNTAVANWKSYGVNKFFTLLRAANTKVRRTASTYDELGPRYNYAFIEVIEGGKRVVKNLIDSQHSFTSRSATAFYFDGPLKIKRMRILLNLAQLGIGFVPVPSWLKSQVVNFIGSMYTEQSKTEGALVGYFESHGNFEMVNYLFNQSQNPYLVK